MGDTTTQTQWTANQDGSWTFSDGTNNTKYVKESDLLAVKGGAESKEKEYQSQITNLIKERDDAHSNHLKAQAALEQSETRFKEYEPFKTQLTEAQAKLTAADDGSKKLKEKLLGRVKSTLTSLGVKDELIKDKTLEELEHIEETARLLGGNGGNGKRPANFDTGGSGSSGTAPESPLERARRILEKHENRVAAFKASATK